MKKFLSAAVAFVFLVGAAVAVNPARGQQAAKKSVKKPEPVLTGLNAPTTKPAGTADNTAPAGFTALFNGKDLAGWRGLLKPPLDNPYRRETLSDDDRAKAQKEADENMGAHWKVENGALQFDGDRAGRSLCTGKDYGDFELWADWKIEAKGDSGIYLRGSPQVQIWDPANVSVDRSEFGSGALYNNAKHARDPLVKADRPIGEWNTFFIRMVGDKVTVYLNGQLVTDNVPMESYWAQQSKLGDQPIFPTGQIELQNHNSPLWFKNVYVRELPQGK